MPVAVFDTQEQTATADTAARPLIPGIEPGGSLAGRELKPALLIKDAWLEIDDILMQDQASEWGRLTWFLKLSQEFDLTPGLILPVATAMLAHEVAGTDPRSIEVRHSTLLQGTIWVPRVVGIRVEENSDPPTNHRARIYLDYDVIMIPWMDYFIMWEFLDNVVDNERQY